MFDFRPYQWDGIKKIQQAIKEGHRRIMLVGPPGCGKGSLIGYMMSQSAKKGNRSLFIVHKRELVTQTAKRTMSQFGYDNMGYYLSGIKKRDAPIMFGSIQTIARRKVSKNFKLYVIDECHRIKTKQYQEFYDSIPSDAYVIGFTATPFRADRKGFKDDFDVIIQLEKYEGLVALKYLVPTVAKAPNLGPSLEGLHLRGGEFVKDELVKAFNNERIYNAVVDKYIEFANGRKTIVFNTNSMEHSKNTAEAFCKRGIEARAIDSNASVEEREKDFNDFAQGKYMVLCNIGLFTEGISIDDVDCIIFNVATNSPTKWVQAATRGSRPIWNEDFTDWKKENGKYVKDHCLIIDFGGNAERHGPIDVYDMFGFSLDGTPPKRGEGSYRTCPKCDTVNAVQRRTCSGCGYEWPISEKKKAFADEVEWKEVNRLKGIAHKIQNTPFRQMMNGLQQTPAPEWLRIIGKIRGFKPGWALHTAYNLGYVNIIPKTPSGIAKMTAYLKKCEENKNIGHMYELVDKIFMDA